MSPLDCERWRGDLALAAIGRLETPERLPLDAHLSACASCQEELAELHAVAQSLELADPVRVEPGFLRQPSIRSSGRPAPDQLPATRSRPRFRWALGGLGVATLAGASLLWLGPFTSPGMTVALHGTQGVQATAVLTSEHWGTGLSLQVAGQPAGRIYHVSMESRTGTWWQAGSYRSESGSIHVELACGVSPSKVDRIWIENPSGRVVLRAYLN